MAPAQRHQNGRPRGARHGKTVAERAFRGPQRAEEMYQNNFDGIHDRFQRNPVHCDSQLKIGWTGEKCIAMDNLAQEGHSCCPSSEEYARFLKNWHISLNNQAVIILNSLHRDSGEERLEQIPYHQYQRWHSSSSSSSTSCWQWNEYWWSSIFFLKKFVVAKSFTGGRLLEPTGVVKTTPQKTRCCDEK